MVAGSAPPIEGFKEGLAELSPSNHSIGPAKSSIERLLVIGVDPGFIQRDPGAHIPGWRPTPGTGCLSLLAPDLAGRGLVWFSVEL
jgi:hypothetical protein